MKNRTCKNDNCKDSNENCQVLGSDGFPVQCVGVWVKDKYYYLGRYLNTSREVRKKFLNRSNAVFIDLFTGPGKCVIKDEDREIDGGALRVLNREEAQFNESFFFDISTDNVEALNKRIDNKLQELLKKYYRYHFVFIDPFNPSNLKFSTLVELARLDRIDMLIHFPIMAIRRNWKSWVKKKNIILDDFLGIKEWRDKITSLSEDRIFDLLINIYKDELSKIGCKFVFDLRPVVIKNTKNAPLYDLILASKESLAQKIWNTVINRSPNGQKSFNF